MALILTETAAGYALFKARDKKLLKSNNIEEELNSPEAVASHFKVKAFAKFESAASALQEANAIIDGKVSEKLSELLKEVREDKKTSLVVADTRLGNSINKIPNMSFNIISDSSSLSIYRALRENLASLLTGLDEKDLSTMSLGLAHSLGRHKLKFSADKVDTMIVQAISLLDDLDKELNTYAMRIKEWYGWHFPEMAKIVSDNVVYARVVKVMGMRSNASSTDLSHVLPEEVETQLKDASEVSMGTEISSVDLENMQMLADQVIDFAEYREQLATYLSNRMAAIAPNLTALVVDLVGARLISHSGSLMSLAKAPASTIQILGAEKALFRALKTKHDTPKYGLLYHSSLIGQATGKNKGKIARMLAAKAAVSLRYDALAEELDGTATVGLEDRIKIEKRLSALEGRDLTVSRAPASSIRQPKIEIVASAAYNEDADVAMSEDVDEDEDEDEDDNDETDTNDSKKRKVEQESAEDKRRRERRESKERKRERKARKAEDKKRKEEEKQQTSKDRDEKRAQRKKEKEERRKRKRED